MTDYATRTDERLSLSGDTDALKRMRRALCRSGQHIWSGKWNPTCNNCGISENDYINDLRHDRERQRRNAAEIACRERDSHDWEPGEEPAEHCGCPIDPVHRCHPQFCSICGICEQEWGDKINEVVKVKT